MKYTRKILFVALATIGWTCQAKGACAQMSSQQVVVDEEEEDDPHGDSKESEISDEELPEGMTDKETTLLLNDWAVKNYVQEGDCDPSAKDPQFADEVYVERLSRMQTVIDMPYNDIVRKYINRYTSKMRRSVSVMLGASNFYTPILEEALESYQLPLELKYLPVIESALNPGATSKAGAAGLWQFMISTGKKYGLEVTSLIDDRRDPVKASYAAAQYLKDLYTIFGNWTLVVAAYNCGPGNVNKAITRAGGAKDFWTIYPYLPSETRGYVPAFIAANYVMNYYCDHNICPASTRLPLASDTIVVTRDLSMEKVAEVTGLEMEELKSLNPQYRTLLIPGNSHDCILRLPTIAITSLLEAGESIYNTGQAANRREVAITDDSKAALTASSDPSFARAKEKESAREKKEREKIEKKEKEKAKKEKAKKEKEKKEKAKKEKAKKEKSRSKKVEVKKGDTLSGIARKNGTTVEKLKKANGLKDDMIKPGQQLKVK